MNIRRFTIFAFISVIVTLIVGLSAFGKFSFDAVGDAVYDPKILVVVAGKLEIFE